MASHSLHIVQAFEELDGGIVPVQPKVCPSAGSARALAARLAPTHAGVIAWSRTGDPDLGDTPGAEQPAIQVEEHGIVGPAIGVDDRAVVAVDSGDAIDQQPPDPVRSDMAERDRRASIALGSSSSRRVVVGAVAHRVNTLRSNAALAELCGRSRIP
jgi:hypothetical protein